jgi:hypothetical protein
MESSLLINPRKFREPIYKQGLDQGILFCDQKNKGFNRWENLTKESRRKQMFPQLLQIREETGSTMSQQFLFLYKKLKILL